MAVRREIHPVRHRGGFRSPVHQLHLAVAVQLIDCSKASQPRPCKHRGILMEQRQRPLSKRRGMDPPTQPAAASDTSRHSSGAARAALSCSLPNHEEVPSRTQTRTDGLEGGRGRRRMAYRRGSFFEPRVHSRFPAIRVRLGVTSRVWRASRRQA